MDEGKLVAFRFGITDSTKEDFLARTDDPTVIAEAEAQLALPENDRHRYITGFINRVAAGSNLEWSWQHVDSAWTFARWSIEVCDAMPSYVEAHLEEWLKGPGRFCPWACHIKQRESIH
jgi:hypothetical protein